MEIRIPDEMRDWYFDFQWENPKVWALRCTPTVIPTEGLSWQLKSPIWSSNPPQPLFDLRPIDVLTGKVNHPFHLARIRDADIHFPLDAMLFRGKVVLLDGFHRLARHILEDRDTVSVRIHAEAAISQIRRSI